MNIPGVNFEDIVEHAMDVIIVTKADPLDESGPEIVYVNHAFTELTGYSAEEAIGKTPRILQGEDTDPAALLEVREALVRKQPVRVTVRNYARNGRAYWLDMSIIPLRDGAGNVTHFAAIERDVTEQKEAEENFRQLSNLDPLTETANRRGFRQACDDAFYRFRRHGERFSVLLMDIDHFKRINDRFGHAAGDAVLKDLAQHCRLLLRQDDTLARIGGEEFCVLLPRTDRKSARVIAERLRGALALRRLGVEAGILTYTVSIGVAEAGDADPRADDVVRRADEAMYRAKGAGRNRVETAPPVSGDGGLQQAAAK